MQTKTQIVPSVFQTNIYKHISEGNGNLVINAVAGSGKTTTIVNSIKYIPKNKKTIFCAFNSSIAKELRTRIPMNVDVLTINSFGWRTLMKHINKPILDDDKHYKIIDQCIKTKWKIDREIMDGYISRVLQLSRLSRQNLASSESEIYNIADKHGMELLGDEVLHVIDVLKIAIKDKKSFDFVDQIFYPVYSDMNCNQYDFVFVDECQDLNRGQQELLLKMLKPNGRLIAVGDPRQAIYGFAGADSDSFNRLSNLPNTTSLPLSVCYRCDASIIKLAQTIVPNIQHKENANEGLINNESKLEEIVDGDLVLCRNTFPLIDLCLKFLSENKKAYVKGKDIGLILINALKRTKTNDINSALNFLDNELKRNKEKLVRRGTPLAIVDNHSQITSAKDRIQAIECLSVGCKDVKCMINKLEKMFNDTDQAGICLSTIHKAKGLEAERVHIVCAFLMPAKWAKEPWEIEQESNITYVAYTRAKHYLSFISDYNPYNK